MTQVPPEGNPTSSLWIVGRDGGETEERLGRPFVGPSGRLLDRLLAQAGLHREDAFIDNVMRTRPAGNNWNAHSASDVLVRMHELNAQIIEHEPTLIIALGNEALRALINGHPNDGTDLPGILDGRGYMWDSPHGVRVIAAIHPAYFLHEKAGRGGWVPFFPLTCWDFRKAKRELGDKSPRLPSPDIYVISDIDGGEMLERRMSEVELIAVDIENTGDLELACLGVAVSPSEAYVIPNTAKLRPLIESVVRNDVPKALQNGMYDRYFLRRFYDVEMQGVVHDTMLGWHALQPELAGMKEKKSSRKTQKSLRMLASIYTRMPWWKDYDFQSEEERYVLCGRDCCTTLEIAIEQREQLNAG